MRFVVAAMAMLGGCDWVFVVYDRPDATAPDAAEHWECTALPAFELWFTATIGFPDGTTGRQHPALDISRNELLFESLGDIYASSFPVTTTPTIVAGLSSARPDLAPSLWPDHDHIYVMQDADAFEGTLTGSTWTIAPLALPAQVLGAEIGSPAPTVDHGFRLVVSATAGDLVELVRDDPGAPFRIVETLGRVNDAAGSCSRRREHPRSATTYSPRSETSTARSARPCGCRRSQRAVTTSLPRCRAISPTWCGVRTVS